MGVFGDTLRQARAQKGVTLKEAEQATRINRHHLSALEEENFAVLPPLIYQRGIVRNYAAYLDLEPGKLLASFEEARGGTAPSEVMAAAMRPLDMPNHWAPNFAIIAFMVVMSAIVFAWIYSTVFNDAVADATVVPPLPTVTPVPTPPSDDTLPVVQPSPTPSTSSPAAGGTTARTADPTATPRRVVEGQSAATNTPQATATAVSTATASAQATATAPPAPAAPTEVPATVVPTEAEVVEEQPTEVVTAGNAVTIRVVATGGGTNATVIGDGQVVFSGWLAAGSTTEWFTAGSFVVTSSDPSATLFENQAYPDWDPFPVEVSPDGNYYLAPIE